MEELLERLERDPGSHKGENGYVGVVAGSRDYTGAPALVGEAALRSGSDLTKILTSEEIRYVVAAFSENLIVRTYRGGYLRDDPNDKLPPLLDWSDSLAVGPGLSRPDPEMVGRIVSEFEGPLVIDADAIEPALDAEPENAVFTPHSGEARAIEEKFGSVEDFAEETGAVVVVKGATDTIYTPGETFENETGHAGMTAGGTGDVLTGVIASLLAQGLEPVDAARLGAWMNGKAGEIAAEEYGNGLVATDLIDRIPATMDNV